MKKVQRNMEEYPDNDQVKVEEANFLALYVEAVNDEENFLF